VTEAYNVPFKFTGKIAAVLFGSAFHWQPVEST
jgi:hypothetical protein